MKPRFLANAARRRLLGAILTTAAFAILAITALPAPRAFSSVVKAGSPQLFPPPPRPLPIPPDVRPNSRAAVHPPASHLGAPTATSGTWAQLQNSPSFQPNGVFLLTDGRVLVQDGNLTNVGWWTLTPDNTGSYIDGTWSQVASPANCPNGYPGASGDTVYSPLYYGSAVLPDGRFVMIGGEYDYNYAYVSGTGGAVWTDQGAIYDPVANSWTCIAAPKGLTQIGDVQSVVLADGTFMMAADPYDNQIVTLNVNTNPPTFNSLFTPPGKSADFRNDEEGWTLLPDGTVLTAEIWDASDGFETPALIYNPSLQAWSSAGIAPDPLVLTNYGEIGPAILRPDGSVFAEGATGFNDIYNSSSGIWTSGPSFPTILDTYSQGRCNLSAVTEQLVAADAPSALLPNGNVLIAASPIDIICGWIPPTEFFEFDGTSLTQVSAPTHAPGDVSYQGRLLVLPTGQVLWTDYNDVEIYTPAGNPSSSWAPTITSFPAQVNPGGKNFQLAGTQFNGLSQAIGYGDDYNAATNYPLVRITNDATGHVFYARTHNHSTMAIATGSTPVSTEFDVPAGTEFGSSTLVVVANGIASEPVNVNVPTPTPSATPTPGGTIAISPNPVVFPNAGLGGLPKHKAFLIQNLSANRALTGNVGAPAGPGSPFSIVSSAGAFNIPPVGMITVKMLFTPKTLGLAKDSLIVTSNDKLHPSVTMNLKGKGVPGIPSLSVPALAFGAVGIGIVPAPTLTLKIHNIGLGALAGNVGALAAPFAVTSGGGLYGPIPPGGAQTVKVQFTPTAVSPPATTLVITTSDPAMATLHVPVSGSGAPGRLATNIPIPPIPPFFKSLNGTLGFGHVLLGTMQSKNFKIKNIGKGDLQGTVPSLSAPFSVTAGSGAFNLLPGQTQTVTVQFAPPTALGHVSQPLVITVKPPDRPVAGITVTVSGRGT
jgi:hypothetical protein